MEVVKLATNMYQLQTVGITVWLFLNFFVVFCSMFSFYHSVAEINY